MGGRRTGRRRGRRRTCGHSFLLAIDKPYGKVTRWVDNCVGRALADDGVGHIGTLDPAVTGVLVLAIGQATKLINHIEEGRHKTYVASIAFGRQTTTDDAQGEVVREACVPTQLWDEEYARRAVASLVGEGKQRPPRFSAIKVDGVRAYDRARAGEDFTLPERDITIYDATLLGVEEGPGGECCWRCEFKVSPGTYIRALARDLGTGEGSAAYLADLCRTTAGTVTLADCVSLEQVQAADASGIVGMALDPVRVLGLPVLRLSQRELESVLVGRAFSPASATGIAEGQRMSLVRGDRLYGVWSMEGGLLRSSANCPQGVEGVRT